LADILGIKLHIINTSDGGGLGAIILAMTGCGEFKNVEEGCNKIIKNVQTFTPNAKQHRYYLEKFKQFKNLYQALKK
jgi:xylulokinase